GMLMQAGVQLRGTRVLDTMLGEQVLDACGEPFARDGYYSLQSVAARRLGTELPKELQQSNWAGELSQEQLEYAARDAAVLLQLADQQLADLQAAGLQDTALLEGRASFAVAALELAGCPLDKERWVERADEMVAAKHRALARPTELSGLHDLFGGPGINWGSPAQVLPLLHERGHNIDSTDEEVLAPIAPDDELVL